jgi:hypothetical protein
MFLPQSITGGLPVINSESCSPEAFRFGQAIEPPSLTVTPTAFVRSLFGNFDRASVSPAFLLVTLMPCQIP